MTRKLGQEVLDAHTKPEGDGADARKAIESLKGKDKVGRVGELLGIASGAIAGTSLAGAAAGAAGATTLLGSSTLAGVLGGVFVTATPIGWVVGTAAAGAAVTYGIGRLIRSGAVQDQIRVGLRKKFKVRSSVPASPVLPHQDLEASVNQALNAGYLDSTQAARIMSLVAKGSLPINIALERVQALCQDI